MALTIEKIRQEVEKAVENATGMNSEQFKTFRKQMENARDQSNEINRKHTAEMAYTAMDPGYRRAARHVISGDPYEGAGLRLGRLIRTITAAKSLGVSPESLARTNGDEWLARDIEGARVSREKALAAGQLTAGGALVPDEYVAELIELKRSRSVVRAAGARVVPMRNGSMTLPKQTGSGTATYVGENSNITKSEQTFGNIQLVAHKLASLTPMSNDLLRESDPSADQIVRDDLAQIQALREDLAFIRDDGTSNTPKGIKFRIPAAHIFDRTQAGATSTLAEITSDLFKLIEKVEGSNVSLLSAGWLMTSRTKSGLMRLRDGNGNFAFMEEMKGGNLLGWPFHITNQIPKNLGGGSDATELTFCEFSQALIADALSLEVSVYDGGTYHDGSALVSGISQDQTVIRAISMHDFALRHDEAAAVLTAVDWGV